jgi:regulatory protein
MTTINEAELLRKAASYCSSSERCPSEVKRRLITMGASDDIATQIITQLIANNFINEQRYCRSFASDKHRFHHWGRIRIRYELETKGLNAHLIAEALDAIDESQYSEALLQMLKTKKQTVKEHTEQETYQKLYRFAAGKGFESHLISASLKTIFKQSYDMDSVEQPY